MPAPKKRKKPAATRHRPRVFITLSPEEIDKLDELVFYERKRTPDDEGSRSSVIGQLIEHAWGTRNSPEMEPA